MKSISNIFAIFFSCMLGLISQIEAQENSRGSRTHSSRKKKKIPLSSPTPLCLMRRIWTSSWKTAGIYKKHYPDYKIVGVGQEQDYFDSRHYSEFYLQNEDEEWVLTIRFDIEEAYQAYMKNIKRK